MLTGSRRGLLNSGKRGSLARTPNKKVVARPEKRKKKKLKEKKKRKAFPARGRGVTQDRRG